MLNLRTLFFGLMFGILDAVSLPIIKGVNTGLFSYKWMFIPVILYAASPFLFLQGLKGESLIILNLVWDLTSDVIVTIIGLYFFSESISSTKMLGVCLSFIALFLMSYEGGAISEAIDSNVAKLKQVFSS
jgi:multidrug transporter EmrE-like cation transporter